MNPTALKWVALTGLVTVQLAAAYQYGPYGFGLVTLAWVAGGLLGVAISTDGHVTYTPNPDTSTGPTFICDDDEWVDTTDYPG